MATGIRVTAQLLDKGRFVDEGMTREVVHGSLQAMQDPSRSITTNMHFVCAQRE